jgi:hypothetical protein
MRGISHIVQSVIPVPGLRPELRDQRSVLIRESNLHEKVAELEAAVEACPWFRDLLDDVRANRKTSIVSISLGALVLTSAVGAGIELGIRHGRDLREVGALLESRHRRRHF